MRAHARMQSCILSCRAKRPELTFIVRGVCILMFALNYRATPLYAAAAAAVDTNAFAATTPAVLRTTNSGADGSSVHNRLAEQNARSLNQTYTIGSKASAERKANATAAAFMRQRRSSSIDALDELTFFPRAFGASTFGGGSTFR